MFNLSKIVFPILAISSPTLAKLAILASASWPFDSVKMVLQLFYLGTIATILTIFAQTSAQRYVTATRAAIIFSLEPAFASFMAYIFAGERLGWRTVIGGVLIIGAIIISETKIFPRPLAITP